MKASEEYVPRQVIESQLLVALDDKSKVAVILSQDDIELLMFALAGCHGIREHCGKMYTDLKQLRDAAFG